MTAKGEPWTRKRKGHYLTISWKTKKETGTFDDVLEEGQETKAKKGTKHWKWIGIIGALLIVSTVLICRFIYKAPHEKLSLTTQSDQKASPAQAPDQAKEPDKKQPATTQPDQPSPPSPAPAPEATTQSSPWIFPDSDQRYLSDYELKGLSSYDLWRARNEIFARRGYTVDNPKWMSYAAFARLCVYR